MCYVWSDQMEALYGHYTIGAWWKIHTRRSTSIGFSSSTFIPPKVRSQAWISLIGFHYLLDWFNTPDQLAGDVLTADVGWWRRAIACMEPQKGHGHAIHGRRRERNMSVGHLRRPILIFNDQKLSFTAQSLSSSLSPALTTHKGGGMGGHLSLMAPGRLQINGTINSKMSRLWWHKCRPLLLLPSTVSASPPAPTPVTAPPPRSAPLSSPQSSLPPLVLLLPSPLSSGASPFSPPPLPSLTPSTGYVLPSRPVFSQDYGMVLSTLSHTSLTSPQWRACTFFFFLVPSLRSHSWSHAFPFICVHTSIEGYEIQIKIHRWKNNKNEKIMWNSNGSIYYQHGRLKEILNEQYETV